MTNEEFERRAAVMERVDELIMQAREVVMLNRNIYDGPYIGPLTTWWDAIMDMYDNWHDQCFSEWAAEDKGGETNEKV